MSTRPTPSDPVSTSRIDSDRAVRDRYSAAARGRESALCCPVDYDSRYLEFIPADDAFILRSLAVPQREQSRESSPAGRRLDQQ